MDIRETKQHIEIFSREGAKTQSSSAAQESFASLRLCVSKFFYFGDAAGFTVTAELVVVDGLDVAGAWLGA